MEHQDKWVFIWTFLQPYFLNAMLCLLCIWKKILSFLFFQVFFSGWQWSGLSSESEVTSFLTQRRDWLITYVPSLGDTSRNVGRKCPISPFSEVLIQCISCKDAAGAAWGVAGGMFSPISPCFGSSMPPLQSCPWVLWKKSLIGNVLQAVLLSEQLLVGL